MLAVAGGILLAVLVLILLPFIVGFIGEFATGLKDALGDRVTPPRRQG